MTKRHCTAIDQWNLNFSGKHGKGSRKKKRYYHVVAKTRWEVTSVVSRHRRLPYRKKWRSRRGESNVSCHAVLREFCPTALRESLSDGFSGIITGESLATMYAVSGLAVRKTDYYSLPSYSVPQPRVKCKTRMQVRVRGAGVEQSKSQIRGCLVKTSLFWTSLLCC